MEVSYSLFIKQLDQFTAVDQFETELISNITLLALYRVNLISVFKCFAQGRIPSDDPFVIFIQQNKQLKEFSSGLMHSLRLEVDILINFLNANEEMKDYNVQSASMNLFLAAHSYQTWKLTNVLISFNAIIIY